MQVTLSDEAKADGRDAVDWYIEEGLFSVAGGFVDKLEHSLHLLSQFPELGRQGPFGARILPCMFIPIRWFIVSSPWRYASSPSPTTAAARGIGRGGGKRCSSQLQQLHASRHACLID